MLLYKKERKQYHETVVDDVPPSMVYGAEHLLRLFGMFVKKAVYVLFDVNWRCLLSLLFSPEHVCFRYLFESNSVISAANGSWTKWHPLHVMRGGLVHGLNPVWVCFLLLKQKFLSFPP